MRDMDLADIGQITVTVLDKRAGAVADNLTRWVTAFIPGHSGPPSWRILILARVIPEAPGL